MKKVFLAVTVITALSVFSCSNEQPVIIDDTAKLDSIAKIDSITKVQAAKLKADSLKADSLTKKRPAKAY